MLLSLFILDISGVGIMKWLSTDEDLLFNRSQLIQYCEDVYKELNKVIITLINFYNEY